MQLAASETGLTKAEIISQLTKSSHKDLLTYVPIARGAAIEQPEFLAHLIAWNQIKGQIRDSKLALPVISILEDAFPDSLVENSLAHLALLDPKNLVRAIDFHRNLKLKGSKTRWRQLRERVVIPYLAAREAKVPWFEAVVQAHRQSMKSLYRMTGAKPGAIADMILFKDTPMLGSRLWAVKQLRSLPAAEIPGLIYRHKIGFKIIQGALGDKLKDQPDVVQAMISQMSPTEVVTATKWLQRLGIKTVPALRAAYEAKLEEVGQSKKATFKTTRAAESITDVVLKAKLQGAQERQMKSIGIEGDWLVLADCSASMEEAIELSRMVAGTLAALVKGKIHLIFFNESPRFFDVTGKPYEQIKEQTKYVLANANTSIGCGLVYAIERKLDFDAIAIVSDGAENRAPLFAQFLQAYEHSTKRDFPVYWYRTRGQEGYMLEHTMRLANHEITQFDLRHGQIDYYSLPQLVQTMRVKRYSLADEIMDTPLLELKEALKAESMGRI